MELLLMTQDVIINAGTLPDSDPLAPPGIGEAWNRMVGVGKWIALGVCVLGLLVVGGKMAFDARRGETTEEISSVIKIVLAVSMVTGGASLITFISGA
ncbi:hypothetical protein P4U43_06495 [Arthrobacter sp. EH-1B-1]|uniref:TrbC/VIRB2 family protein n=1 Tax=Arthrobacter vasquezii TaxID=2977629 RepID=A0ABT6CUJ3_9MICC|nr:hypothetical protein [Arthrobacter vasquezii]MDF9277441.1 hypothetical protein [Arthrobacter vasquezii]